MLLNTYGYIAYGNGDSCACLPFFQSAKTKKVLITCPRLCGPYRLELGFRSIRSKGIKPTVFVRQCDENIRSVEIFRQELPFTPDYRSFYAFRKTVFFPSQTAVSDGIRTGVVCTRVQRPRYEKRKPKDTEKRRKIRFKDVLYFSNYDCSVYSPCDSIGVNKTTVKTINCFGFLPFPQYWVFCYVVLFETPPSATSLHEKSPLSVFTLLL